MRRFSLKESRIVENLKEGDAEVPVAKWVHRHGGSAEIIET